MALNDNATLVPSGGHFYTADISAAFPTDLSTPGTDWTEVGHTSLTDLFAIASDGGDATTIGTLQNQNLRTTYAPRTESFTFTLEQFDTASLKLYYGSNAVIGSNGEVQVPSEPVVTTAAFLAVFSDGDNHFAFYAPKAEIFRGDDLSLGDNTSLAGLPISVKPIAISGSASAYSVTPIGDTAPAS